MEFLILAISCLGLITIFTYISLKKRLFLLENSPKKLEELTHILQQIQSNTQNLNWRTTALEIRMEERGRTVPPIISQISEVVKRGPGRPKKNENRPEVILK